MDASVKEEPSEVTEEMNALYEDVMENGLEMETVEVDDSLASTDEPSCNSRPPRATTTPRRETTKLMTIHVRPSLKGFVVTPTYSARSMCSQKATSRTPASGAAKRFTVIVPRRTPYDKHFQERQGEYAAKTGGLMRAIIGMSSAPIVLLDEEASRECSDEKPDMTRGEQSASAKEDDAIGTAKACAEATSSLQADADPFPASTKERNAEMMPGPSNSDAAMDPTRTLEATTSTARKAPGGRADRRKQELNTTKTGNNVQRDVLDEEQVIVLTKKKKRSYTIEEKLRAVEYAMQTSTGAAARVLGYNRNTVQGWCRQTGQTRETALLMKCRHPVNL